jgi:hypothetical protein
MRLLSLNKKHNGKKNKTRISSTGSKTNTRVRNTMEAQENHG